MDDGAAIARHDVVHKLQELDPAPPPFVHGHGGDFKSREQVLVRLRYACSRDDARCSAKTSIIGYLHVSVGLTRCRNTWRESAEAGRKPPMDLTYGNGVHRQERSSSPIDSPRGPRIEFEQL
jgi:hypothetical protein